MCPGSPPCFLCPRLRTDLHCLLLSQTKPSKPLYSSTRSLAALVNSASDKLTDPTTLVSGSVTTSCCTRGSKERGVRPKGTEPWVEVTQGASGLVWKQQIQTASSLIIIPQGKASPTFCPPKRCHSLKFLSPECLGPYQPTNRLAFCLRKVGVNLGEIKDPSWCVSENQ